jgi:hypothetical protein
MEQYKMIVGDNIDISGKFNEGTLAELIESTGFSFFEIDEPERPYLVYRDENQMENDPDGRYAIGYLVPIRKMD